VPTELVLLLFAELLPSEETQKLLEWMQIKNPKEYFKQDLPNELPVFRSRGQKVALQLTNERLQALQTFLTVVK
jgi:hypothetical protein